MKVKDVIQKLSEFDGELVVVVYDSVYEDYTSRLLFEVLDDSYVNHDENVIEDGKILLL